MPTRPPARDRTDVGPRDERPHQSWPNGRVSQDQICSTPQRLAVCFTACLISGGQAGAHVPLTVTAGGTGLCVMNLGFNSMSVINRCDNNDDD